MGKNSNVHTNLKYISEDLRKEREADAKKAAKRVRAEEKLAEQSGQMIVEADAASSKKKSFGKIKVSSIGKIKAGGKTKEGKKSRKGNLIMNAAIKPSLGVKKKGIRKPSSLMKKTLKKIARSQDSMVL